MENDLSKVKSRTVLSLTTLFLQSGYSGFLGLVANLVLTILLSPKIFGIYITVLSIISVLNYFSDIGLAASLIQKPQIDDDDIKTTFTIQQTLIITTITIGFLITGFVKSFYKLPLEGTYLYWALLGSFFLSSLKTIPSIFLERKIQFQKIVFVQVLENTVFYATAIALALSHFGLESFTVAVLLRATVGVIAIYSISFWMPKIGISTNSVKKLLSFGIPFQASSFLALFKDDLITLFLGKVLGFEGLGYIGWAKKWAEAPIRIVMDNVSRVLFPVISRLQEDKERVGKLVDKILYYQTLLLAPTIVGLALIMPRFVEIIPKYGKWAVALPYFYLFCISGFLSSYSTPFMNLFNALGKVKISFGFMLFWTITTWILTPTLTKLYGLYGFPLTQVALTVSVLFVVLTAKKNIQFHFFQSISPSLIAAAAMGTGVFLSLRFLPVSLVNLTASVLLGSATYFILLLVLFKINLIKEVQSLFANE